MWFNFNTDNYFSQAALAVLQHSSATPRGRAVTSYLVTVFRHESG